MKKEEAFTLIELMISLAISGVVLAAIYAIFFNQQKSYLNQEATAAAQQTVRAAEILLERDIRMAGFFDPDTAPPVEPGFIWANDTSFQFTMDANRNSTIDPGETITYCFDNANHSILRHSADPAPALGQIIGTPSTDHTDAVNFVYLDGETVLTNNPLTTADLTRITTVQITLVERVDRRDSSYTNTLNYKNQQGAVILAAQNDHFRRRTLTLKTQCRNLWLRR